jgi:hypothetical protein
MRLRGHFNGTDVVLDEPVPPELKPNTPVEVVIPESREQALRDLNAFLNDLWSRPLPKGTQPSSPRWKREDLYERGSR